MGSEITKYEMSVEVLTYLLRKTNSVKECTTIYFVTDLVRTEESELGKKALKKIQSLLRKAKSFQECMEIWLEAPYMSAVAVEALKKTLSRAKSFQECVKIHVEGPYEYGEDLYNKVINKTLSFMNDKSLLHEYIKVCNEETLPCSEITVKVLEKAFIMADSFEEYMDICDKTLGMHELKYKVLNKALNTVDSFQKGIELYARCLAERELHDKIIDVTLNFVDNTKSLREYMDIYDEKIPVWDEMRNKILEKFLSMENSSEEYARIYLEASDSGVKAKALEKAYKSL